MSAELDSLITPEMRACIGRTSPVVSLPEEISASDVRRYAQAVGDDNPLWRDDEVAQRTGTAAAACRRCWWWSCTGAPEIGRPRT